ncbi:MAG: WbqC family protein [Flavobacteriaceae bacterium]
MRTFYPSYFSSIIQYAAIVQSPKIQFETFDNYQKQTYRNRAYVYGPNGKQLLNIPIKKIGGKQLTRDVKIDDSYNWQLEHLKSLKTAYNSSPFYEFYIDDLMSVFTKKETFLLDLNLKTTALILKSLDVNIEISETADFKVNISNDFRFLIDSKSKIDFKLPHYYQVFNDKHGFLPNLSILDLLFMEGPASLLYLRNIDIELFKIDENIL